MRAEDSNKNKGSTISLPDDIYPITTPVTSLLDPQLSLVFTSEVVNSWLHFLGNINPETEPQALKESAAYCLLAYSLGVALYHETFKKQASNVQSTVMSWENDFSVEDIDRVPERRKFKIFTITYLLDARNKIQQKQVHSPWHIFDGFIWRLNIFPRGNSRKNYLGMYLECGGPISNAEDCTTDSEKETTETAKCDSRAVQKTESWKYPTRFFFRLIHPSRMAKEGISNYQSAECTEEACSDKVHVIPEDSADEDVMDDGLRPLELVKDCVHTFRKSARDWGFHDLYPLAILTPGRYVDENFNVALKVNFCSRPVPYSYVLGGIDHYYYADSPPY